MTWIFCALRVWDVREMIVCSVFFSLFLKNYSVRSTTYNIFPAFQQDLVLKYCFCGTLMRAEENMTWIFCALRVWDVREMIVCSVFFLFFAFFLPFFIVFLKKNVVFWTLFSSLQNYRFLLVFLKNMKITLFLPFFDNYRVLDLFYSLFWIALFYRF